MVVAIDEEFADVLSLLMRHPDDQQLPLALLPGQYVVCALDGTAAPRHSFTATRSRVPFRQSAIGSA